MSVTVTPEIQAAFDAYLNEAVDWDLGGAPMVRRNTYPYNQPFCTGIISFVAGWQARGVKVQPVAAVEPTGKVPSIDPADVTVEVIKDRSFKFYGTWLGIRLTHVPTGLVAESVHKFSQTANKAVAWSRLTVLWADYHAKGEQK